MAETLGSLCDKLTIVKLKEWHSEKQPERLRSVATHREEIDTFIPDERQRSHSGGAADFCRPQGLSKEDNAVPEVTGSIGAVFAHLAEVNCRLWHEVDKGYEIEKVPPDARDGIVKQLAVLNLERAQCIDEIDRQLAQQSSSCNPRPSDIKSIHLIHRTTCRVCGSSALTKVIDLGEQYLQGSFVE